MIDFVAPAGQQGRLATDPKDSDGNSVALDSGAFVVAVTEGSGTFEYNSETNGLVFRRDPSAAEGAVTVFHVDVDGEPGKGASILPIDVRMTAGDGSPPPPPPPGQRAVVVNESVTLEADGTPA